MIFLVPSTGTLHSLRDLSLKIYVNLDNFLGNNFHTTLLVLTFSSLPKTLLLQHKMPALIQQTTNVYLNFALFIINRGCKTDIKRSVHIGFFSQCFLLSCLKPTINIVTFNLELQMCRKNLNLSTSPTLPSFNLSLQEF